MTKKKIRGIELKNPLRIRINKSPVIVNFRTFQVGVSQKLVGV